MREAQKRGRNGLKNHSSKPGSNCFIDSIKIFRHDGEEIVGSK